MATKFTIDQVIEHMGEEKITQTITEMYDFAMQKVCRLFHPRLQIIMDDDEYPFNAWYLFPCFIYFSVRHTIYDIIDGCVEDTSTMVEIEELFYKAALFSIIHEACHATQSIDVIEKVYSYSINDSSYEDIVESDNDSRTIVAMQTNATEIMEKFKIDVDSYNFDDTREGFLPLKDMKYVDFIGSLAETFMAHHFKSIREYNNARMLSNLVRTAVKDQYAVVIFDINEKEIIIMGSDSIVDGASPDEIIDWLIENKFYLTDRTINRIEIKDASKEDYSFSVIRVEVELEITE